MQGLLGIKRGMTQVYDDAGRRVAVTVLEAGPCVVTQVKTKECDGYEASQLGFIVQKAHRMTKPMLGHFAKAGADPHRCVVEFESTDEAKAGDTVTVSMLEGVNYVDIAAKTKGRGFAGVLKRHNMKGGRMTHGGHSKRRPGSIGQCSYPANVAKGKRMPGHMGNVRVTCQNLRVVSIDPEKNLLLVCGAVPGPRGAVVEIRKALKKVGK
ncbi:MAG: large subunit ribosomal protein L3 [Candidatus Promineifilaceae bacterium]|jgi:large subunit ribosomal protein L3